MRAKDIANMTLKEIADSLNVDSTRAKWIRQIARYFRTEVYCGFTLTEFEVIFARTNSWIRSCFHPPTRDDIAIHMMDEAFDGHGVEVLRGEHEWDSGVRFEYSNAGETYQATVVYDTNANKFIVACWGDCVEWMERNGYTRINEWY